MPSKIFIRLPKHSFLDQETPILLVSCLQVGPEWDAGDSKTGAKLQIYLSSQSSETITAPYTVALAGPVAYRSAQSWSWNGTVDASGQVSS